MSRSPQELYYKMAMKGLKRLGDAGEKKAARYLKRRGWKILERNYKNPFGEVDIIASRGDITAFIEVKTRLTDTYGEPSEAVNKDRQRRYISAAKYYSAVHGTDCTLRFDIIEIYCGHINRIENAFY